MVVDAVIQHWVVVVALAELVAEVLRETIQELADFFYTDYGLVVSPQPERLQRTFNVLIYLFYRFGLRTNMRKTVSIACWLCYTPCGFSDSSCMRQVTGVGP